MYNTVDSSGNKITKKGAGYVIKPYDDLPKTISYKNDYLKNKATRGSLEIRSKEDTKKLLQFANERIDTLKLFFFNDHLTDKDIQSLASKISKMNCIENIHADFGKYDLSKQLSSTIGHRFK